MAKQQTCQKFVFKIHTKRLVEAKWDLTLPLDEARRNHEIISLADSTVLRWIDELNGVTDAEAKARSIKRRIKMLRNEPSCLENRREIRRLYTELDTVQFKPDYMKDMREKNIAGAEANFYDQLRSPGTQWAADMSVKAIKENAFFDENDMQEIFDTQRELIDKFQKESDDAKEKYRLSLIENQRLKELLEDAGIDASVKDTDGDAV